LPGLLQGLTPSHLTQKGGIEKGAKHFGEEKDVLVGIDARWPSQRPGWPSRALEERLPHRLRNRSDNPKAHAFKRWVEGTLSTGKSSR